MIRHCVGCAVGFALAAYATAAFAGPFLLNRFAIRIVPEPGSIALVGIALVALFVFARRAIRRGHRDPTAGDSDPD
jgi:hypothetical protein